MSWKDRAIEIKEEKTKVSEGKSSWKDRALPVEGNISMAESGLRGAAQGVSFGFADEIVGGAKSIVDDISQLFTGEANGPKPKYDENGILLNQDELLGSYQKHRDEYRQADERAREANPSTFLAGEVGGGIASSLLPGGALLNAGKGAKLGTVMAKGAAQGGLYGAGSSNADNAQDLLIDASMGTALGAGGSALLHGAGKAVGKVINNKNLSKLGNKITQVDDEAILRRINRPDEMVAAEADDFIYNISQRALDEIDDSQQAYGKAVGKATDDFLESSGSKSFKEIGDDLAGEVEKFLERNKVSDSGFSALQEGESQKLEGLLQKLKSGDFNGEDLLKLRENIDNAQRVAKKYDQEGTGPFINFLKQIRHKADVALDSASEAIDTANKDFAKFKRNKAMLGLNNERTVESQVSNLYGTNKVVRQKAAEEVLSPQTLESIKDVSANKAFNAQGPSGSKFGLRNMARAGAWLGTLGTSEIILSPSSWKHGATQLGRLQKSKFGKVLSSAAEKGSDALRASHYILLQQSPEYRQLLEDMKGEENE